MDNIPGFDADVAGRPLIALKPESLYAYGDLIRRTEQLILTQPVKEGLKAIKVRLDARTVITLASKKALEFWKQRYPKLEIIG